LAKQQEEKAKRETGIQFQRKDMASIMGKAESISSRRPNGPNRRQINPTILNNIPRG
jgi:hypothetical protein